jgi:hypothetical protein
MRRSAKLLSGCHATGENVPGHVPATSQIHPSGAFRERCAREVLSQIRDDARTSDQRAVVVEGVNVAEWVVDVGLIMSGARAQFSITMPSSAGIVEALR